MTIADDVRAIAREARPAIKQWLDAAELITGFREVATEKGLNWSALKAVIVASIKDEEDGGDRVKKLADKADDSLTYADAIGNKIKFSEAATAPEPRPASLGAAATPPESKSVADSSALKPVGDGESGPERPPGPDSTISDDIPAFLRRPLQQEAGQ